MRDDIFQVIRDQEMDRKEFLTYSGLALLSLIGFKTIASLLMKPENKLVTVSNNENSMRGFGSGRYGV